MKIDFDSTEPDVRIEIVPLIDVIFCILTFFILAAVTLTRQAAINVDLPRAASGTNQMRQILIVSVDPIGQTYVEKLPVSKDQLYQAILSFRQQNPEGMMVLYASRAASYNDVVQVLDLLRSAGGDRVALATLPGGAGDSNTSPFPSSPLPSSSGSLNPNDFSLPSAPNSNSSNATPADPFGFGTSPGTTIPKSGTSNDSPLNLPGSTKPKAAPKSPE